MLCIARASRVRLPSLLKMYESALLCVCALEREVTYVDVAALIHVACSVLSSLKRCRLSLFCF